MTELQKHYEIVLNDMLVNGPDLFKGIYDAHLEETDQFMYGIQTVMEYIACSISDQRYDTIENMFIDNMDKSLTEAGRQI